MAVEVPFSSIPLVNLQDYHQGGAARAAFIQTLGKGMEQFGFVAVAGHGIPLELLQNAYAQARATFALPEDIKKRYETPQNGRQRGYTSFGVEHAKNHMLPDLKEFWHIGRTLPVDHPLHQSHQVPPNLFPAEAPDFGPIFSEMFIRMEDFANTLLAGLGSYMGYPEGFFSDLIHMGNSVLRVIHYPDLADTRPTPGAVRAAAHEDINLLTVLPISTQPGLELMTRDGQWLSVQTPPDVMVCDTGDMMSLLTNGRMPATTHRVVNPEGGSDGGRLSMPFFLHPRPDAILGKSGDHEIQAATFLHNRLQEIGVA